MHAVILQHHPIEGPGCIPPLLAARAMTQQIVHLYAGESCPAADCVDLLIILGGPMSVNDEIELPWLRDEKEFIRRVIARDCPVLGICLGAQLIASALGAAVRANTQKEIGWLPIETVTSAATITLPSTTVFQWHGETFDLPVGATLLARSVACAHQAFLYKENVLALQFHLETTPELVRLFVETGSDELTPAPYVQSGETILAADDALYRSGNLLMETLLNALLRN